MHWQRFLMKWYLINWATTGWNILKWTERIAIYTDFVKAYDKVNHQLLVIKPKQFDIRDSKLSGANLT